MYKQLTKDELKVLLASLKRMFDNPFPGQTKLANYVAQHYGPIGKVVVYAVNSEYNDNTYDNRLTFAIVRDANGVEVHPSSGDEQKHRRMLLDMAPEISEDSNDPIENDIIVYLSSAELPKVFVEVSK